VKKAVAAVLDHFDRLDVLVNNAGIWKRGPIGKMRLEEWEETLDTNLRGAFLFCNSIVPHMKKRKEGKIINIASTAGQRGEAYYSHYAASKGGLIAFTKSIAVELAPYNVIVNCVAPGWVETDMTAEVLGKKRELREIQKLIPRGRMGTAEDVAGAALFLASDLSSHIVGSVISVNGGSVLFG
jgi:3-oxoacyl-[acyl-carrier protein] reductase